MFQRLGHWLRAAGYDTVIEQDGRGDYELLQQARRENRLLVTRDRKLMEHRGAPGTVVLLDCDGLDDCAAALDRTLGIDWLFRPFSRCMNCNSLLQAAGPRQLAALSGQIPGPDPLDSPVYCRACHKLYWNGGHVRRMRERLEQWQAGNERATAARDEVSA